MTSLAVPVRREFGTVAACLIALVPALLFAAGWAAIQVSAAPLPILMLVGAVLCPGWVSWVALRARSEFAVVLTAVLVSTAVPAFELVIGAGGRLERAFYISLIALAILVGVLVAMWVMRRGGRTSALAGFMLGALAMILVLTPLLSGIFLMTT